MSDRTARPAAGSPTAGSPTAGSPVAGSLVAGSPVAGSLAAGSLAAGRWPLVAAALIAVAITAAYSDSFGGPFIFDDVNSIPDNPHIRHLWPISEAIKAPAQETVAGRPVLSLSLSLTYAIWGLNVVGYHAVNLAIHILAALTLFGIVRRTLSGPRLAECFGRRATALALAVALCWGLHPLNTQAVTYIIQRAESLMGLFYLVTLYCVIRSAGSRQAWAWWAGAVVASCLGMGTKEVMATAPIVILAYDRIFLAGSFAKALARRWPLYAGLAASWLVLAGVMASAPRGGSAGFGLAVISPLNYAKTQCQVILHYLRLAFWPVGQSFDYTGWRIPAGWLDLYIPAAALASLLAGTAVAFVLRPAAGFLGLWFFLILAPTSSFVPLADVAFEHRMYLPLAAVVAGAILAGYAILSRVTAAVSASGARKLAGVLLVAALAASLAGATYHRNEAYGSGLSIWADTVRVRPDNYRAHNDLALAYVAMGDWRRALRHYDTAIRLRADDADAYVNRGACYARMGRDAAALKDFNRAIELNAPKLARPARPGRLARPGESLPANMRKKYASVFNNRGIIYKRMGMVDKALADYGRALALYPDDMDATYNQAVIYLLTGKYDLAIVGLDKVISLGGRVAVAPARQAAVYDARGVAYFQEGRRKEAIADFDRAIRLDPTQESYRAHRRSAAGSMPSPGAKPGRKPGRKPAAVR